MIISPTVFSCLIYQNYVLHQVFNLPISQLCLRHEQTSSFVLLVRSWFARPYTPNTALSPLTPAATGVLRCSNTCTLSLIPLCWWSSTLPLSILSSLHRYSVSIALELGFLHYHMLFTRNVLTYILLSTHQFQGKMITSVHFPNYTSTCILLS